MMTNNTIDDLKKERNTVYARLYRQHFAKIQRFVIKNSGQASDAEDIFQDTLLVLFEKLRHDDFKLTASLGTYLYAISKNLWLKRLRDGFDYLPYKASQDKRFYDDINTAIKEQMSIKEKITGYLSQISSHCHRLIHAIFYQDKSITEIQNEYGYSSRHNAQNQKHKCIKQIKKAQNKLDEDEK